MIEHELAGQVTFPVFIERHWSIVLLGNFTGGALGTIALAWGGVFDEPAANAAMELAEHGVATPW